MANSKSIKELTKEIRGIIRSRVKIPVDRENIEHIFCKRCKQSVLIKNQNDKNEFKRLHANHNVSLWDRVLEKIK